MESGQIHLLRDLKLPDRFERLFELLGPEVARLLVLPDSATAAALQTASLSISNRGEGMFVPVHGESGAGKTTLASNLTSYFPRAFTPSTLHTGDVSYDSLNASLRRVRESLPANDHRIIPINVDHREGAPPSRGELAELKRFLRAPSLGARSIVLWPETNLEIARATSAGYVEIADESVIDLPLRISGPPPEVWREVVQNTMELVNNVGSLGALGVDPRSYDPSEFRTIGKFIRRISIDFNQNLYRLIASTQKPMSVAIVVVSESGDAGVLEKLCNSARLGLLDAAALIAATPSSAIGKWWDQRRGLLVQTILQLNAHAFALTPAASIAALRQFGSETTRSELNKLGISSPGPRLLHQTLSRSDVGKYLTGRLTSSSEDRGTPAATSTAAFQLLAEQGFTYGADKTYNQAMREAWDSFLASVEVPMGRSTAEKKLGFCSLIPDNALYLLDQNGAENIVCLEYTWRKGDFLGSRNKAVVASYILEKLRNYARELGWAALGD